MTFAPLTPAEIAALQQSKRAIAEYVAANLWRYLPPAKP